MPRNDGWVCACVARRPLPAHRFLRLSPFLQPPLFPVQALLSSPKTYPTPFCFVFLAYLVLRGAINPALALFSPLYSLYCFESPSDSSLASCWLLQYNTNSLGKRPFVDCTYHHLG
jgi:hypothetical protein